MQGEVSYREPEDHPSFTGDVESGSGVTAYAATPGSIAAKKAMLFTSILLFTVACVLLVQLGNDRPPALHHDSGLPVAPHELKDNKTSEQPKRGRLKTGGIFILSTPSDQSTEYEYENFALEEEMADESEDVQSVTLWTMSTSESMELTTLNDSSLLPVQEFAHSLLNNTEQQNYGPLVNETADILQILHSTSPVPLDYIINHKKKEEMNLKKNLTIISVVNPRTVDSVTNETIMTKSTIPNSPDLLSHPVVAINNSSMAFSEVQKQTKMKKTTTPTYSQLASTKYFTQSTSTIRYHRDHMFPQPPRPSNHIPKSQQPKNYYMFYLQRGHFPLCAAVLAFFRYITECFK